MRSSFVKHLSRAPIPIISRYYIIIDVPMTMMANLLRFLKAFVGGKVR